MKSIPMKKAFVTIAVMLLFVVLVIGVGFAADPTSAIHAIDADSPCPVTGCASGECHGFDNVPVPDGVHEMICPEAGCASTECHAWDSLIGRYHQASDASLNVWILMPVALVVSLLVLVRVMSKKEPEEVREGTDAEEVERHE